MLFLHRWHASPFLLLFGQIFPHLSDGLTLPELLHQGPFLVHLRIDLLPEFIMEFYRVTASIKRASNSAGVPPRFAHICCKNGLARSQVSASYSAIYPPIKTPRPFYGT